MTLEEAVLKTEEVFEDFKRVHGTYAHDVEVSTTIEECLPVLLTAARRVVALEAVTKSETTKEILDQLDGYGQGFFEIFEDADYCRALLDAAADQKEARGLAEAFQSAFEKAESDCRLAEARVRLLEAVIAELAGPGFLERLGP